MESAVLDTNGHLAHVQGLDHANDSTGNGSTNMAQPDSPNSAEQSEESKAAATAPKARKRTKTGCLTCRRRRIKCGEERPTCKNCTKSKRECEGYVPRVVFKDPVNAFRQNLDALQEHHLYGRFDPSMAGFSMTADGVPLAPLAPRPSPYDGFHGFSHPPGMGEQYVLAGTGEYSGQGMDGQIGPTTYGIHSSQQSHLATTNGQVSSFESVDHFRTSRGIGDVIAHSSTTLPTSLPTQEAWTANLGDIPPTPGHVVPTTTWPYEATSSSAKSQHYQVPLTANSHDGTFPVSNWSAPSLVNDTISRIPGPSADLHQRRYSLAETHIHAFNNGQLSQRSQSHRPSLCEQTIESEDDLFDVDSDQENLQLTQHLGQSGGNDLSLVIQMSAHRNNVDVRSITDLVDGSDVLATYQPAYAATPLMDADTARVFCHFIVATGPALNVCDRHTTNPAILFSGRPVPESQRSLWSYSLPMLALKHQGLLHSMLALSSLHIAKLQQSSPTPSLKHYHYALRRVAKALSNPIKRRDVATLAATLLLGFYEVTTAEHNKWNSHLSGARELIAEIDFAGMSTRLEAQKMRQEEEARFRQFDYNGYDTFFKSTYDEIQAKAARRLDEHLISTITGRSTECDMPPAMTEEPLRQSEIENFQVQCDLFWWYAKQDMYQSILSGNRLLLSYDQWGHCPPRAPVGWQDASYGTMDHLLLLMARLADFAAKDLPRKRRAGIAAERAKAQPQTPHANPTGSAKGQSPPFYGMMPDPGPVRLPSGFDQSQHDKIYSAPVPSDNQNLETATAQAHAEHVAIGQAFDTFEEAMGISFEPLSSEHMTPTATPFGPAIYYRSYPIACVQALFQCARIILARAHPSMPPAAMAAAGVAAPMTAIYANNIGRICAGVQPVSHTTPLNPHHSAALIDICMPLFHAGVQYRDPAQRGWIISKLCDVARLTGFQTSALVASGCERAWIRAAEIGRGPPYERTMNRTSKDDRVAGRSRDPRFMSNAPRNKNDRRFVKQNPGARVHWAMGILSVEEDMREMSLNEGEL